MMEGDAERLSVALLEKLPEAHAESEDVAELDPVTEGEILEDGDCEGVMEGV